MPDKLRITAAVLAVGAIATVIPTAAATAGAPTRPLGAPRVFVTGDSLTVGSAPYLRRAFSGRAASITINARVGRFTPEGMRTLRTRQARNANAWVVALGTNDAAAPRTTERNVKRVLRLAKGRSVYWLTLVRPGKYELVNRKLRALDHRYSRLTVIDWSVHVRRARSLLAGDGVHLTSTGYRVRAQVIARAVLRGERA